MQLQRLTGCFNARQWFAATMKRGYYNNNNYEASIDLISSGINSEPSWACSILTEIGM